jgi:hypothetical protein
MQTSVKIDLQNQHSAVPDPRVQRPPADADASQEKKAHLKIVRPITLPEDVVTFTDSNGSGTQAAPAGKNSSLPVTNAEKKALLGPHPTGYNFSIYG